MTQEQLDVNFLISVFNGWTYKSVKDFIKDSTSKELHNYNEDWNKLMHVVEEIGQMNVVSDRSFYQEGKIHSLMIFAPIQMVWLAVIEFIKWYNQNKQ